MYCKQGGDYSVKPGCPRRQNVETLKLLVYYQPLWDIDWAGKANPHSVENVGQVEGIGHLHLKGQCHLGKSFGDTPVYSMDFILSFS